jgi:hypothetical protein
MTQTLTLFFERKLSDGAYGSEGFSLGISQTYQDDEAIEEVLMDGTTVERLHNDLRQMVLERLAQSSNGRVSFTAQRELHADDDEHERAMAWANSNASAEERAIRSETQGDMEELPF